MADAITMTSSSGWLHVHHWQEVYSVQSELLRLTVTLYQCRKCTDTALRHNWEARGERRDG